MPTLIVQDEDRTWLLDVPAERSLRVGRSHACEVPLETGRASRRHAEVRLTGGRCFVKDLKSTNGTLVNGVPLEKERELREGDEIEIGDCRITFRSRP